MNHSLKTKASQQNNDVLC